MPGVTSIGDAAAKVVDAVEARMGVWKLLGAAAAHARTRGVRLCLIERGFVVSKGTKSEIIPFVGSPGDHDLNRSIDRVADRAAGL